MPIKIGIIGGVLLIVLTASCGGVAFLTHGIRLPQKTYPPYIHYHRTKRNIYIVIHEALKYIDMIQATN